MNSDDRARYALRIAVILLLGFVVWAWQVGDRATFIWLVVMVLGVAMAGVVLAMFVWIDAGDR